MNFSGSNIAFRADASQRIGTGHLVRCLTLAEALRERGARCLFLGRRTAGDLHDVVREKGHEVCALADGGDADLDWDRDAREAQTHLRARSCQLLVCDHYGLDQRWEHRLRGICARILVIDDLADRLHDCDVLLDQNLGRSVNDYRAWVAPTCDILAGPSFALLRPQFGRARPMACERRDRSDLSLRKILVSLGGADATNATADVLAALDRTELCADVDVDVVVGAASPWLESLKDVAARSGRRTTIHSNVTDMAGLMIDADLAIGAGGTTSWERCCLAVPTLLVILADNQRPGAKALADAGAARIVGEQGEITANLPRLVSQLAADPEELRRLSHAAARITDGAGVARVLARLEQLP